MATTAENRSRTEVIPEVVFLGKLVERIVSGKVRIPKFQRPFVWRQADLLALLDSVLQGYPIGSILVWDTEVSIETSERVGPVLVGPAPQGLVSYLLDGQQRVSTLVGTLQLPSDTDAIVDQVDWKVYCDLDKQEFLRSTEDVMGPQYFPVASLLTTSGFFAACRRIAAEVSDKDTAQVWLDEADRLANAFRDYQLPLIHIRDADLDSAVTVFARLNRTGRKMTADEMVSALTYREGEFHLAKKINEFKFYLSNQGFGNIDRVLLLRAVLAALDRDIYAKDWADLMVKKEVRDKLPEIFKAMSEGITKALSFLEGLGVASDRLLPYGLQLVLLGEFFRICPEPSDEVRDTLKRWFWVTSFTGWFGNVNTTRAAHALTEMRGLARGTVKSVGVVDLEAPAQAFPTRFDGRSARVRAYLLYLTSLRPRSLTGSGHIDVVKLLANRGTRALGYLSSSSGARRDLLSSPANRMYIDEDQFGQAYGTLQEMSEEVLRDILPTHGFSEESWQLLREGDRGALIESRLANLIEGERRFMRECGVRLPEERTTASVADSETSEDEWGAEGLDEY